LNTTLLDGALCKVLTNASMLVDATHPDPAAAEFDELGIGTGIDGSRRRHCLSGPESDRRGRDVGSDQALALAKGGRFIPARVAHDDRLGSVEASSRMAAQR